jgi:hypothetical protein
MQTDDPTTAHGGNTARTLLRQEILSAPWVRASDFFLTHNPHARQIIRERTASARRGQRRLMTTATPDGVFWARRWAIEVGKTGQHGGGVIFVELEVKSAAGQP